MNRVAKEGFLKCTWGNVAYKIWNQGAPQRFFFSSDSDLYFFLGPKYHKSYLYLKKMSQDDPFSSYKSPLSSRYSSDYMKYLYSDRYKFQTWRKLWTILAKAQHDLGLSTVSQESVDLLKQNINNIDFEQAKKEEKKLEI